MYPAAGAGYAISGRATTAPAPATTAAQVTRFRQAWMVFTMFSLRVVATRSGRIQVGGPTSPRTHTFSVSESRPRRADAVGERSYRGGSGSGTPRCGGGSTARRVGCDRGGVPATRVRSAREDIVGRDDPVGLEDGVGRDGDDGTVAGVVWSIGGAASGIVVVAGGVCVPGVWVGVGGIVAGALGVCATAGDGASGGSGAE